MNAPSVAVMRASLWLLFAAASAISLFWLMLVVFSAFQIWRDSNAAGLALQGALILFPVALIFGLMKSKDSLARTAAVFVLSWIVVVAATAFFGVPLP
jgi:uncharacterized membrane protein YGL010W